MSVRTPHECGRPCATNSVADFACIGFGHLPGDILFLRSIKRWWRWNEQRGYFACGGVTPVFHYFSTFFRSIAKNGRANVKKWKYRRDTFHSGPFLLFWPVDHVEEWVWNFTFDSDIFNVKKDVHVENDSRSWFSHRSLTAHLGPEHNSKHGVPQLALWT